MMYRRRWAPKEAVNQDEPRAQGIGYRPPIWDCPSSTGALHPDRDQSPVEQQAVQISVAINKAIFALHCLSNLNLDWPEPYRAIYSRAGAIIIDYT